MAEVNPCGLVDNAGVVGEGVKAALAVILPHAAFADAAEAHCGRDDMNFGSTLHTTLKTDYKAAPKSFFDLIGFYIDKK